MGVCNRGACVNHHVQPNARSADNGIEWRRRAALVGRPLLDNCDRLANEIALVLRLYALKGEGVQGRKLPTVHLENFTDGDAGHSRWPIEC